MIWPENQTVFVVYLCMMFTTELSLNYEDLTGLTVNLALGTTALLAYDCWSLNLPLIYTLCVNEMHAMRVGLLSWHLMLCDILSHNVLPGENCSKWQIQRLHQRDQHLDHYGSNSSCWCNTKIHFRWNVWFTVSFRKHACQVIQRCAFRSHEIQEAL